MIQLIEDNLAIKRHARAIGEKRFQGFVDALRKLHRVGPLTYDFSRANGIERVTLVAISPFRHLYVLRLTLNLSGQIFLSSYADGKEKVDQFDLGIDYGVRAMAGIIADKLAELSVYTLGVK